MSTLPADVRPDSRSRLPLRTREEMDAREAFRERNVRSETFAAAVEAFQLPPGREPLLPIS